MKVINPGYTYSLVNFDAPEKNDQIIQFIRKEHVAGQPAGSLTTVTDGTTNEEVLEMLIDRLRFLHKKLPSRQSSLAITKLEEAMLWLNARTAERKVRGVEGTNQP